MKCWRILAFGSILIVIALVIAVHITPMATVAQPQVPTTLLLRPAELPDCQWNGVRELTPDYPGPFSPQYGFAPFQEGYQAGAICPQGYVVSLVYYYKNKLQAMQQYQRALAFARKEAKRLYPARRLHDYGAEGQGWQYTGSEGTLIYFFVRPKGRALIALVVDGPPRSVPDNDKLIARLVEKIRQR